MNTWFVCLTLNLNPMYEDEDQTKFCLCRVKNSKGYSLYNDVPGCQIAFFIFGLGTTIKVSYSDISLIYVKRRWWIYTSTVS